MAWLNDIKRASSKLEEKLEKALPQLPWPKPRVKGEIWTEETWNKEVVTGKDPFTESDESDNELEVSQEQQVVATASSTSSHQELPNTASGESTSSAHTTVEKNEEATTVLCQQAVTAKAPSEEYNTNTEEPRSISLELTVLDARPVPPASKPPPVLVSLKVQRDVSLETFKDMCAEAVGTSGIQVSLCACMWVEILTQCLDYH